MTIPATPRIAGPFTASGSSQDLAFAFRCNDPAELVVQTVDPDGAVATLVLNTDYTVALNGNQAVNPGGEVTLTQTGVDIYIKGATSIQQALVLASQGGFYPAAVEAALDKLTMVAQEQDEKLGRALLVPLGDTGTGFDIIQDVINAAAAAAESEDAAAQAALAASGFAGSASNSADEAAASALSINPAELIHRDGSVVMAADLGMNGNDVVGLPAVPAATGAASKEYADRAHQRFCVYRTSNQTFTSTTVPGGAKLEMNVVVSPGYDPDGIVDLGSPWRVTPTEPGIWRFEAVVSLANPGGASGTPDLSVHKNGSYFASGSRPGVVAAGEGVHLLVSVETFMNGTTDYVELYVSSNAAGTKTVTGAFAYCRFQGRWVGA